MKTEKIDVSVGFDLDFKGPPEGRGKYRTRPHLLALSTPDGIFCDKARVEVYPDDGTVRLELLTAANVGEISVTLSLDSLEKIITAAKKSLAKRKKE